MNIRSFQPGDESSIAELLAETMPAEGISVARFTRQVLLDPNARLDGLLVAESDHGQATGLVVAIARQTPLENAPSDSDRGYITLLAVRPDRQRKGIATALLSAAETYLRAQNRSVIMVSSYAPGYFIPGVDIAAYAGALKFFAARGYTEVYRPIAMQAELWSVRMPEWVDQKRQAAQEKGIRFEPYHPALTRPLLEFTQREFPGDWVRVVRTAMDRILQGESSGRLIVCHDGNGAVLGFSHHDAERFGPIGTAAAERGRGLGQVLMHATLRAQREAGFRAAWFLWSDDKTAARLYSGAGFKEVRRFALLKKQL